MTLGVLLLAVFSCVLTASCQLRCGCSYNRYAASLNSLNNEDQLFEGDMKLSFSQRLELMGFRNTVSRSKELWPNGVLVYDVGNHYNKANIKKSLNNLSKRTKGCITFREKERYDEDYVRIIEGSGCWSSVGRQGGRQEISLDDGCETRKTIQHEFIHALGFDHEQARKDRGKHIRINWRNIESDQCHNFNMWGRVPSGPYDIKSIMHYGSKDFSCNGQNTITTTDRKSYKEGTILTKIDVLKIRTLYGCE